MHHNVTVVNQDPAGRIQPFPSPGENLFCREIALDRLNDCLDLGRVFAGADYKIVSYSRKVFQLDDNSIYRLFRDSQFRDFNSPFFYLAV